MGIMVYIPYIMGNAGFRTSTIGPFYQASAQLGFEVYGSGRFEQVNMNLATGLMGSEVF